MKLKLDDNGNAVLQDGKPVYVYEDGKEVPFDAPATLQKISALNGEAKAHREAKEAAEARLEAFKGIEDAAAAKKALETVRNLDDKKLIDAGEAERVKSEAIAEANKVNDAKLDEEKAATEKLRSQFYGERIGNAFARSKFIADNLSITPDMTQAFFGKNFSVLEDGKVVAKDESGNVIYSRINAGEIAGVDEALEVMVGSYPHKDTILKGSGASGGGLAPSAGKGANSGGNAGGTRSDRENYFANKFNLPTS